MLVKPKITKLIFQGTNLLSFPLQDVLLCHLASQSSCVILDISQCERKKQTKKKKEYVRTCISFKRRVPSILTRTHTHTHIGPPSVFPSWLSNLNANVPKSDSQRRRGKII